MCFVSIVMNVLKSTDLEISIEALHHTIKNQKNLYKQESNDNQVLVFGK